MTFTDRALSILGRIGANEHNIALLEPHINKLVPFVGAGLSADFGYPQWKPLLQSMADPFPDLKAPTAELLALNRYEEAAELVFGHLPNFFNDTLTRVFDHTKLMTPLNRGAVRQLPRFARGPVVTTNFDRVIETAFESAGCPFGAVFAGSQIYLATRMLSLREPCLLKLHGDYLNPDSRVFTLSDYQREYGGSTAGEVDWNARMPRVLQAVGANPLLFLGCSLEVDRTTLVVAKIARDWPGALHFALLSSSENTSPRLRQLDAWNIRPLFFPSGEFNKIGEFLECLATASEHRRNGEVRIGAHSDPTPAGGSESRTYLTGFVGREAELAELSRLSLANTRMVTLTGAAGTGKTRLAVEAIVMLRERFPDGVYFIPLEDIRDPEQVLVEIASKLELSDATHAPGELANGSGASAAPYRSLLKVVQRHLANRHLLLLLDNFEQVIEAAVTVAELLMTCPGLTILATSRERLQIRGEVELALEPLSLPDPGVVIEASQAFQYSALALFVQRAVDANSKFELTSENIGSATEICRALDGLPLSIELAAAKLVSYSLESILSHLSSRLRFLTRGPRDLPSRQQALRASIQWSYDLLDASERRLFRLLAVFAGGFDFAAVQAIAEAHAVNFDPEAGLVSLVEKNLLRSTRTEHGARYKMFEAIRDFGVEVLHSHGEEEQARWHYADYFAAAAQRVMHPPAPTQYSSLSALHTWLRTEIGNLRAVLDWAVLERNIVIGIPLFVRMQPYWLAFGHATEGRQRISALLQIWDCFVTDTCSCTLDLPDPRWVIDACQIAAILAQRQDDYTAAKAHLHRVRALALERNDDDLVVSSDLTLTLFAQAESTGATNGDGSLQFHTLKHWDERRAAMALLELGIDARVRGDKRAAQEHLEQSSRLLARTDSFNQLHAVQLQLAALAVEEREPERAIRIAREALERARDLGQLGNVAATLLWMGRTARQWNDLRSAEAHLGEALSIASGTGDRWLQAQVLFDLGMLAMQRADFGQAERMLDEAEAAERFLARPKGIAACLMAQGRLLLEQRRRPVPCLEALTIFRRTNDKPRQGECLIALGDGEVTMSNYDEALKLFQEARSVFEEAKDFPGAANAILRIGHVYRERNDYELAHERYGEALAMFRNLKMDGRVAGCLKVIGDLHKRQGNIDQARANYDEALKLSRARHDSNGIGNSLMSLGELAMELKE
jgi:predicted ATPase/predicted negative regulator of RcsB-dependent stress response